ncbi:hypothetical protein P8452_21206 [Trifolium repens]|nr:hypothetical protein P8452_21206 [Trifolium repens]
MNDLMHRYNDGTWIKDGLKAQEVARLTTIFTEEYDAEQNSLPVHVRDSPAIRQMKISHAFVKYVGGKHRGRTFATGSTSSFYQRAPGGIRDIGDTSYSSHMSQGRSRVPQETPTEQEAQLRAEIREEVRNEVLEEREQALEQQVEQLFRGHWNAAYPTQGATQRSSTSQNYNARPSPSSQPPPSNHRNHPSTSQGHFADTQGYRPDLSNLSRNNIDLNQGLPEHQLNDPTMNINIEDYDFSLDDVPMMFVHTLNPTMQTSGSGGRGARNINNNQNFNHGFMANQGLPNQQGNPIQSGRGRTGGRRVILPALTINEGGRGRSTTTRAARNVSRGRGGKGGIGRGKEILVEPEPEEDSE